MYGVAYRMVGRHRPDAEDAVQEAWLRAVRGLPGFRGDSALQSWLVGIAIECALEVCRRRRPADVVVDAPAPAARGSVDAIDLERVIASLADGYRHVLLLHDVHGHTHAEIAELLGIEGHVEEPAFPGTSPGEASAFRRARGMPQMTPERLPREIAPPPTLEDRTVGLFRSHGLLTRHAA